MVLHQRGVPVAYLNGSPLHLSFKNFCPLSRIYVTLFPESTSPMSLVTARSCCAIGCRHHRRPPCPPRPRTPPPPAPRRTPAARPSPPLPRQPPAPAARRSGQRQGTPAGRPGLIVNLLHAVAARPDAVRAVALDGGGNVVACGRRGGAKSERGRVILLRLMACAASHD